ncbi:MAG: hypothetical protein HOH77_19280 [Candidatus Latescibacteria bacterium]|jgi:hypothetical protein|nr:hypothetical protein [Candidatus Latescibacterota bacterium]
MENEWISTDPRIWRPEKEGDALMGKLLQKRPKGGKYQSESYVVENHKALYIVFGTAVLEDRMKNVSIGDIVRIEYKGTKKNKRDEDTKIFEVFRKKEEGPEPA